MDKKMIEKEVAFDIKTRRESAKMRAESNLDSALKNDSFKKLYYDYKNLVFDIAKNEYQGKNVSALKNELKKTVKNISAILMELNYNLSDFKPQFFCSICNDVGFINGKRCQCFNELLSLKLLNYSGKHHSDLADFEDAKFDVYDEKITQEMRVLFDKMKTYSSSLSNTTKKVVILTGQTGVGKTFLTDCIVNSAIKNGYFTIYTTAINLNGDLLKYHLAALSDKNNIINNYLNCDLLVIDDLGTEPILKNVTEEYLYLIISERLLRKLNTIITTNLSLEQIQDAYGDRIFSRLANQRDCWLTEIKGSDLRLAKPKK